MRPEEDRRCEDSLESLNNPPVVTAVRSKTEKVEHLNGGFKVDNATLLLYGERSHPDRNQSVLSERHSILGMSRDLEKETPVPSRMGQLTGWGSTERHPTEDKRPGVKGEFLLSMVSLLARKMDGFELPKPSLRLGGARKTRTDCGGNGGQKSVSVRVSVDPVNQGFSCHSLTHVG